jgi:AcrR family transcriptional regulator
MTDSPDSPPVIWIRPERSGRGPTPSLSRDKIAAAAVKLADEEGFEAVSMRALATRLGVGATSLYRYVERKDELVDLMVDSVIGSDLSYEPTDDYRANVVALARKLRAMLLAHPWMAVHGAGRPSLGPNSLELAESVFASIDGIGLDIDEMMLVVNTIDAYVRGIALAQLAEQEAIRRSGLDQDEWMMSQKPWVGLMIESGLYPLLTRVVTEAETPHDPDRLDHAFEAGLERILDGLLASLEPAPDVP